MSQLDDVLALLDAVDPSVRGFRLLGIGGHGASGKTTLARAVAVQRPDVQVVGTDSFWNGQQFELDRLRVEVVEPLVAGRPGSYREWDWPAGSAGQVRHVLPVGTVIVEGVCALHQMFRAHEDVRIWVDAPVDLRLARGVARDGEASRQRWTDVWMPNEDAYVARDRPVECAHLTVDGTRPL